VVGLRRMAILDHYAGFVVDLDGAFDAGDVSREATAFLRRAGKAHKPVVFVTDDASRTPDQLADRFAGIRVVVKPGQIVTSATSAALLLELGHPPTMAIGTPAFVQTLTGCGRRWSPRDPTAL